MIGQFVYTRSNGSILLGDIPQPGGRGEPLEGFRCVGSTASIANKDWVHLSRTSNFQGAAAQAGERRKWIPVWTLNWLPSGALAVGKTVFFPPQELGERECPVTHYYVLDRDTALENSGCMEKLFTLPFIDFNLNNPENEAQRNVLRNLREYPTLEAAGAKDISVMPLGTLLNEYMPIGLNLIRNTVEACMDAAIHKDRKMLIGYDHTAANAEENCMRLMGWIYRLIPKHIRGYVSFALPLNNMSQNVQFAMIPEVNLKVDQYSQGYRSKAGDTFDSLDYSYLLANKRVTPYQEENVIFHQQDRSKPEIYCAARNLLGQFLAGQIKKLYYDMGSTTNLELQQLYEQFCREGWNTKAPLTRLNALELMLWSSGQCDQMLPKEDKQRLSKFYAWIAVVRDAGTSQVLSASVRSVLFEKLLLQMCSIRKETAETNWLATLRIVLKSDVRDCSMTLSPNWETTLEQCALELAAVEVAKVWKEDYDKALALCDKEFSSVALDDGTAAEQIVCLLTTPGTGEAMERWQAEDVSCDPEATTERVMDRLLYNLKNCTDHITYLRTLQEYGQPLNALPEAQRKTVTARIEQVTQQWLEDADFTIHWSTIRDLYRLGTEELSGQDHGSQLAAHIADEINDYSLGVLQQSYPNATLDELKELKQLSQYPSVENGTEPEWHQNYRDFCATEFRSMYDRVLTRMEKEPVTDTMLATAAKLLDIHDIDRSWRYYNRVCGAMMGDQEDGGYIRMPEYITAEWLMNQYKAGYLRYHEGKSNGNVLSWLMYTMNGLMVPEDLKKNCSKEDEKQAAKRVVAMYHLGRFRMTPGTLYQYTVNGTGGIRSKDALSLIQVYDPVYFEEYARWLLDQGHIQEYLDVMAALSESEQLHMLPWESIKEFLSAMVIAQDSGVYNKNQREQASRCGERIWSRYKVPILEQTRKKTYVIPSKSKSSQKEEKQSRKDDRAPREDRQRQQQTHGSPRSVDFGRDAGYGGDSRGDATVTQEQFVRASAMLAKARNEANWQAYDNLCGRIIEMNPTDGSFRVADFVTAGWLSSQYYTTELPYGAGRSNANVLRLVSLTVAEQRISEDFRRGLSAREEDKAYRCIAWMYRQGRLALSNDLMYMLTVTGKGGMRSADALVRIEKYSYTSFRVYLKILASGKDTTEFLNVLTALYESGLWRQLPWKDAQDLLLLLRDTAAGGGFGAQQWERARDCSEMLWSAASVPPFDKMKKRNYVITGGPWSQTANTDLKSGAATGYREPANTSVPKGSGARGANVPWQSEMPILGEVPMGPDQGYSQKPWGNSWKNGIDVPLDSDGETGNG